jgi:hypothetical protein
MARFHLHGSPFLGRFNIENKVCLETVLESRFASAKLSLCEANLNFAAFCRWLILIA